MVRLSEIRAAEALARAGTEGDAGAGTAIGQRRRRDGQTTGQHGDSTVTHLLSQDMPADLLYT